MPHIFRGRELGRALIAEGLVPEHCRHAELHIDANAALFLHYEVLLTDEDIPKLQRALGTLLADSAQTQVK